MLTSSQNVSFRVKKSSEVLAFDKLLCLTLNEFTGFSHLHSVKAREQRRMLRQKVLLESVATIAQVSEQEGGWLYKQSVLKQTSVVCSLMAIEHLVSEFNSFEFNRLLVSSACYHESVVFLLKNSQLPEFRGKSFV